MADGMKVAKRLSLRARSNSSELIFVTRAITIYDRAAIGYHVFRFVNMGTICWSSTAMRPFKCTGFGMSGQTY